MPHLRTMPGSACRAAPADVQIPERGKKSAAPFNAALDPILDVSLFAPLQASQVTPAQKPVRKLLARCAAVIVPNSHRMLLPPAHSIVSEPLKWL